MTRQRLRAHNIAQRVCAGVEARVDVDPQELLALEGFHRPVPCCRLRGLKA